MTVSFRSNPTVVKLPQLKPVDARNIESGEIDAGAESALENKNPKKAGFVNGTVETWKGTLKTWEGIKCYTGGFFRGIKNAVYAGAALVGIDWFATSAAKMGATAARSGKKEAAKAFGNMILTPFEVIGKTISNGYKFIFGSKNVDSIFVRPNGQTFKYAFWEAPKRVLNRIYKSKHVSPVAKWGLPIIFAATLAYTTIRSVLDYNERAARIDHRYGGKTGHHTVEETA